MKNKILLALSALGLVATTSMADIYVGVEYGAASNETETEYDNNYQPSSEIDNDYSDLKIKFGAGKDGGIKVQTVISFIEYDKTIFDNKNKDYVEIGFDFIKEFEVASKFYPFIKAGIGFGSMDVQGYNESQIYAVSLNLGTGVSYKVIDHIYLIGGVDYVYRKYQDIEGYNRYYYNGTYYDSATIYTRETSDSAFKPYIGVNFQF